MAGARVRTCAADPSVVVEPKRKRHRTGTLSLSPAGGVKVLSGYHPLVDHGAGFMGYPLASQADTPPFSALTLLYPLALYVSAKLAEVPSLGHDQ